MVDHLKNEGGITVTLGSLLLSFNFLKSVLPILRMSVTFFFKKGVYEGGKKSLLPPPGDSTFSVLCPLPIDT